MLKENFIYRIKNIGTNNICNDCSVCLRLVLFEKGLIQGEKVSFHKQTKDMWIMSVLSERGHEVNRLALRNDEFEKIVLEEMDCLIDL